MQVEGREDPHHGTQVWQLRQRVWNAATVRRPPPVPPAVQRGDNERPSQHLRQGQRVPDLADLMVDQSKVALHRQRGRIQQRRRHVCTKCQKAAGWVIVLGRVHIPQHGLSHAVPLAVGARKLEGGVHHIRLLLHPFVQALHKERVATRECGHGKNADLQLVL